MTHNPAAPNRAAAETTAQPYKPRRVMVIAGLGWSLVNFRLDLLRRMRALGHEVIAVAPDFDSETRDTLIAEGIRPLDAPLSRTGMNPLQDLKTLAELRRLIRDTQPDVVLPYTMKPIVWGGLAARLEKIACVPLFTGLGYAFSEAHPRGKRRLVRRIAIWLHRFALRDVRLAFYYNTAERRDLRHFAMLPEAAHLVHVPGSGVETARFAQAPLPDGPLRFLFVGRMLRSKGLEELAEASAKLRAQGREVTLDLVGPLDSNPDAISDETLQRWQDEGLIRLHPATRDVRPYLRDCHVFVMPSKLREGVPRTILEAMSTGRAVITSDAPGCGETLDDGVSGLVVPAGDSAALAQAMARFLDDPDLAARMGQAARDQVCARNDVHLVNRLILTEMGLEPPEGALSHPKGDPPAVLAAHAETAPGRPTIDHEAVA